MFLATPTVGAVPVGAELARGGASLWAARVTEGRGTFPVATTASERAGGEFEGDEEAGQERGLQHVVERQSNSRARFER